MVKTKEEELEEKGKAIFKELEKTLLSYYIGQYCVIHVPSKEYFVNPHLVEALRQASSKYSDKQFYSVKIGEKGVAEFK